MRGGIERDVILCAATGQSNSEILRDKSPTLNCNCEQPIVYAKTPQKVAAFMAGQAKNARSIAYNETLSPTLKGAASGLNQTPSILCAVVEPQIARTLTARHDSSPCVDRGQNVVAFAQNQRDEVRNLNDVAGCLAAYHGVKQQTYVVHPEITGTLCGSGAGTSRTVGNCNETDLAVAYCLQGNMIGRADKNGPQGKGVNTEISFTLNTIDHHAR